MQKNVVMSMMAKKALFGIVAFAPGFKKKSDQLEFE